MPDAGMRLAQIEDYPVGGLKLIGFEDMRLRLSDGYLVKGLLASGAMAVIYGDSGTGKTFLALYLSLNIAAGEPVFGRRVRRVGVVYVAAEAGASIESRVAAAKHEIEFPESMPFAAVEAPIDLCTPSADTENLIAAVRAADLGFPVGLIVIDTLSRVMAGGNENQPDDMGALVRNVDRLRAETAATVLLIHHSGKEASRGARGHSLLRAATDTEIEVTRDEVTKVSTARVTKQREYATEGALAFTLRHIELATDTDGDPITSCIVEPTQGTATTKKTAKLAPTARLGLEQLRNCVIEHAEDLPRSTHVPVGARGVTLDRWRGHLEKAGLVNPEGNPREQFKRICVTLQDAGFIGVWKPHVWLSQRVT